MTEAFHGFDKQKIENSTFKNMSEKEIKSILSSRPYLVTLAMGELLTCTVCAIFSWEMLSANPRLDNLPAILGYIASIFGGTAAISAIYGSTNQRPVWLLVHSVLVLITIALMIPVISSHVFVLAATADGNRGTIPDITMYTVRKMAWRIGTQIVLFTMLTMLLFTTHSIAQKLHKKIEEELLLQNKLTQYMHYENEKRKFSSHYFDNTTINV